MDDSYARLMAEDLFGLIEEAAKQGVKVDWGFENRPVDTPSLRVAYIFQTKQNLMQAAGMTRKFANNLKKFNILAAVIESGKATGVFHLCAFSTPFSKIPDAEAIFQAMRPKDMEAYTAAIRKAMSADLDRAKAGNAAEADVTPAAEPAAE
jgi:hypothetical protein